MTDEFDLDWLEDEEPKKPKRDEFDDAFADTSGRDIRQATSGASSSRMAGNYEQLTFRLRPEVIDQIFRIADELGVSKEEAKRWVVDQGLANWRKGIRPETVEVVRRIAAKKVRVVADDE